jgi:hypothetical protein
MPGVACLESAAQPSVAPTDQSSPPPPLDPQPLLRMFPYPAFDDIGYHLHGGFHVDLAVGVARQRQRLGKRDAETAAGKPDDAAAENAAIEAAGKPGEDRRHLASPPEKHDVDAAGKILVHDHADGGEGAGRLADVDDMLEPLEATKQARPCAGNGSGSTGRTPA